MRPRLKNSKRRIGLGLVFCGFLMILVLLGMVISFDFGPTFWLRPTVKGGLWQREEKQIKEFAFKEGLKLVLVERSERALMTKFSSGLTCVFSLEKNLESQLASLQFILWRSKIEGEYPTKVDLRFDKPVISY